MSKNTTMRNCNLRVSSINNTKEGTVKYTYEDFKNMIIEWSNDREMEYFTIEHSEDKENVHYHAVIKFSTPVRFDTIKNKFPYGNIEKSKSVKNSVQYLLHMNNPEKFQHSVEEIFTNSTDLNKYLIKSKVSEELDLNYYLEEIMTGNIKQYEYTEKIPGLIYTKHATKIDRAFKVFYDKCLLNRNRNIDVIFMSGLGGTGKTLYAKTICEMNNESYYVSSSSNDVLQDYKGEDVLILDDLRDSVFEFDDFLKIIDNNTNSSIKSRYNNKLFIGNKIIITSSIELCEWYKYKKYEGIHQLHRRIQTMLKFKDDEIFMYRYDKKNKSYKYVTKYDNTILLSLQEEEKENENDILEWLDKGYVKEEEEEQIEIFSLEDLEKCLKEK